MALAQRIRSACDPLVTSQVRKAKTLCKTLDFGAKGSANVRACAPGHGSRLATKPSMPLQQILLQPLDLCMLLPQLAGCLITQLGRT